MRDRSWEWHEEVKKHDGLLMRIVKRFNTEQEAFNHEQELINKYKNDGLILVNKTDGGSGVKGYKATEQRKKHISDLLTGYVHEKIECHHCGHVGGKTSMKRWHFDKCTGLHPTNKIRTTIFGKRIYLGKAHTVELAKSIAKEFYDFVMEEKIMLDKQRMVVL